MSTHLLRVTPSVNVIRVRHTRRSSSNSSARHRRCVSRLIVRVDVYCYLYLVLSLRSLLIRLRAGALINSSRVRRGRTRRNGLSDQVGP